ncbi:MAG: DDE-type integrase/transposase/recombinase [Bilophila sp.]
MTGFQETYTPQDLATLLCISRQAVALRAKREGWQSRPRSGRGGGFEWLLASMPEKTRLLIAARSCSTVSTPVSPEQQAGLAAAVTMQGKAKARAEARVAVISLYRMFTVNAGLPVSPAAEAFAARWNAGEIPTEAWVREALPSLCRNSVLNWDKTVKTDGVTRLAGKYGMHRKGTGTIDSQSELYEFVLAMLFEYPHIGAQGILNGIKARFVSKDLSIPSLRRLQAWIAEWKRVNAQVFAAIVSPDEWRNVFLSSCGDAGELICSPNQRWEFDGTPSDLLLADGKRHTILGVIDVYTRRVKLHVSRTGTATAVASLLRRTILDWGIPKEAVTDNGAEYVAAYTQQVMVGLGIYQNILPPFRPDLKPFIERVFRTFSHDHLELLQGYAGHSVAERKKIENRKSFAQRLMEKDAKIELRLTPEELQEICDTWTDAMYGNHPHSNLKGKTPNQMISEWNEPLRGLVNGDERALDVLLLPLADGEEGWRTVSKKGVKAGGGTYNAATLGGLEGQRIQIRLDEAEMGVAYLFNEAGEFVCRAIDPDLLGISKRDIAVARRSKQRASVAEQKKQLRDINRKANVKDIAREIRDEAVRQAAANPVIQPEFISYTTPELEQATAAALAGKHKPPQIHNADVQAARETARLELTVVDAWQPKTPRTRFALCKDLKARLLRGETVPAEQREWMLVYENSNECQGFMEMESMYLPHVVNE